LGETKIKDYNELQNIINELKKEFKGEDYDTTLKNCNNFSNEFVKRLGFKQGIPNWINRVSYLSTYIPFFGTTSTKQTKEEMKENNKNEFINKTNKEKEVNKKEVNDVLINDLINEESSECLNSKKGSLKSILKKTKNNYLESDVDQQLLIFINFKKKVNLSSIEIITNKDSKKNNN
jgi:hypothetical protein